MPTRIVMANGDHVSVSDSVDAVAEQLNSGKLTRLERPWGDTAIYVNPSEIAYLEAQEERNPNIEAMEATAPAAGGAPAGGPPAGGPPPPGAGPPGTPPRQPGAPGAPGGPGGAPPGTPPR